MKQIIEYYGNTIIAILIASTVLTTFCTISIHDVQGVPALLGRLVSETVSESKDDYERTAFRTYVKEELPEIYVADAYAFTAERWYLTSDCLSATDVEGDFLMVKAVSGWLVEDENTQIEISNRGAFIYCPKPGAYWVIASVKLDSGRTREVMVKILVNEEGTV